MFVETKREGEIETQPAIKGLIAWLETKKPSDYYNWGNCMGGCLIGQYLATIGLPWIVDNRNAPGMDAFLKLWNRESPMMKVAFTQPWTYGGALKRARAIAE